MILGISPELSSNIVNMGVVIAAHPPCSSQLLRMCNSNHGLRYRPFVSAFQQKRTPLPSPQRSTAKSSGSSASTSQTAPVASEQQSRATHVEPPLAFKANLDFKFIRDNVQMLEANCR